jgi:hypothetical protein
MHGLGYNIFFCPRCGTLKQDDAVAVPALVDRCRCFVGAVGVADMAREAWPGRHWHKLGIAEAIDRPRDQEPSHGLND